LKKFFQDSRTFETLSHSLEAQPQDRVDARSDFDTYTSAINISPNGNGSYDVKQMKDDALWLNQVLKVDEVTALRIVILEWQSRSENKLRERSTQDASSGLPAVLRLRSSLLRSTIQSPATAEDSDKFDSQASRRLRLLKTWCEERQFQFKCLEQVVIRTMEDMRASADGQKEQRDDAPWSEIGPKLVRSWNNIGDRSGRRQRWLGQTVDYLGYTAQQLSGNGGVLSDDSDYDGFQPLWSETKGAELAYALHITLTILQSSKTLSSPDDFGSWFHLMGEVNFFEGFEIVGISDTL
jgi:nuclear pore complex protein Nup188